MATQRQATVHRLRERRRQEFRRLGVGHPNPALVVPFGSTGVAASNLPLTTSDVQGPGIFILEVLFLNGSFETPTLVMHGGAGTPGIEVQLVDPGNLQVRDGDGNLLLDQSVAGELAPDGAHTVALFADPSADLLIGHANGREAARTTSAFSQWGDLTATWTWNGSVVSLQPVKIHPGLKPAGFVG